MGPVIKVSTCKTFRKSSAILKPLQTVFNDRSIDVVAFSFWLASSVEETAALQVLMKAIGGMPSDQVLFSKKDSSFEMSNKGCREE